MNLLSAADGHMHTQFSDGDDTVRTMISAAVETGLAEVVITDHVRATTEWVDDYVQEIAAVSQDYASRVRVFSGIEAKVNDLDGNLDARLEFFDAVDMVIGSFHRIPVGDGSFMRWRDFAAYGEQGQLCWWKAFQSLLRNPHVHVIGHLGAEFLQSRIALPDERVRDIARMVADSGKAIDVNLRYRAPESRLLQALVQQRVPLLLGSDSHSALELRRTHSAQHGLFDGWADNALDLCWTMPSELVGHSRVRH